MGGRPIIDLVPYKSQIITWFQDDYMTVEEITDSLRSSYEVVVNLRTVKRRLKLWGISKRTRVENTTRLRARIAYMFCVLGFIDPEMLHALKHERYTIRKISLQCIQCEQRLWQ